MQMHPKYATTVIYRHQETLPEGPSIISVTISLKIAYLVSAADKISELM